MSINITLDFNAALEKYKANKVYNKENYIELLSKYSEAVQHIRTLEDTITELQKKTLPTVDEIKAIKSTLGLLGIDKLDADGIQKVLQLKSIVEGAK